MSNDSPSSQQSLSPTTELTDAKLRSPSANRRRDAHKSSPLRHSVDNHDPENDDASHSTPLPRKASHRHGNKLSPTQDGPERKSSGGFLLKSTLDHVRKKRPQGEVHKDVRRGKSRRENRQEPEKAFNQLDGQGSQEQYELPPADQEMTDAIITNTDVSKVDFLSTNRNNVVSAVQERASSSYSRTDSSVGSSPSNSKQSPKDKGPYQTDVAYDHQEARSVDPSQIVRMALNLSEAKRMHLSPGALAAPHNTDGRRSTSAGLPALGTTLTGSHHDYGGSLRQALQEPRRASRNMSQSTRALGDTLPKSGNTAVGSPKLGDILSASFQDEQDLQFSPATIARAEKARVFIELSHEYRRLLQSLPPLVPHNASNGKLTSFSVANTTQSARTRGSSSATQPQLELGRPYDPLQYIRNRRVRARERGPLDAEAAGWTNIDRVQQWIESVETSSKEFDYYASDIVMLPKWEQPPSWMTDRNPTLQPPADKDESGNKLKRQKMDWSINPADLLADAYWLEQHNHKALIESRNGNKIFPHLKQSQHRISTDDQSSRSPSGLEGVHVEDFGSPESTLPKSPVKTFQGRNIFESEARPSSSYQPAQGLSTAARVRRHLLRRPRTVSVSSADLSESDDEARDTVVQTRKSPNSENTGPLERYMNRLENELKKKNSTNDGQQANEGPHAHGRRWGVSEETQRGSEQIGNANQDISVEPVGDSPKSSMSVSRRATPRISIDQADEHQRPTIDGGPPEGLKSADQALRNSKPSALNFLRWGRSKAQQGKEAQDLSYEPADDGSVRSSFDSLAGDRLFASASDLRPSRSRSYDDLSPSVSRKQDATSNAKRLFKGGRIGELVRSEKPDTGDIVFKRQPPRERSYTSLSAQRTSLSSDEDEHLAMKKQPSINRSLRPTVTRVRSHTSVDPRSQKYHNQNLPAFTSLKVPENKQKDRPFTAPYGDHIERQQKARQQQKQSSRFKELAPPGLDTTGSDISPGTSSLDLSRYSSAQVGQDRGESTGTQGQSDRPARPGTLSPQAADRRLKTILGASGGVGRGGLPVTGLSGLDATNRGGNRHALHRSWSIADSSPKTEYRPESIVNKKEIAYVRTLLLASGVKAKGIEHRANEPRDKPPDFLFEASRLANSNTSLTSIPRRQEHIMAARLLSKSLESSSNSFERDTEHFRKETCFRLQASLDDLRDRVGSTMIPHVRSCADEADAFVARLTTTHTLAVKQVNDSVDLMMRSRRARLRWIRRTGFGLLEWTLVGLMWWIWLFVLIIRVMRNTIVGLYRGARWLLWL